MLALQICGKALLCGHLLKIESKQGLSMNWNLYGKLNNDKLVGLFIMELY